MIFNLFEIFVVVILPVKNKFILKYDSFIDFFYNNNYCKNSKQVLNSKEDSKEIKF